ncbi:alanine racemase [Metallumcola ferriviriculae]|uniref:Alanine racemase n=1 Tax=Metallumcola ferriviriculae TaxID=3039180 RepID=A0AAU0UKT8_9FIRM|nr:alanine racemase [Desulfitibacteraceae bacterium MK1]
MDDTRWIEVDLDKIIHNYRQVKEMLDPETLFMAVVKANAYGMGMVSVAKALSEAGVDWFGVTYANEGITLRQAGISLPILVFAPLLTKEIDKAISAGLTLTVSSEDQVEEFNRWAGALDSELSVHVKVESGMGRTGVFSRQLTEVAEKIVQSSHLKLQGIYTHFPRAAKSGVTEKQYHQFTAALEQLEEADIDVPLVHCCNSTATINYPKMHRSLVRVGTLLYGQYPGGGRGNLDIRDPWSARCQVTYLRKVPRGTGVGYGQEYSTRRDTFIGIIPFGTADGFGVTAVSRAKSWLDLLKMLVKTILNFLGRVDTQQQVYVDGRTYPVIGRLGMQLSMVDFGTDPPLKPGDTVNVFLRRVTAAGYLERRYYLAGDRVFLDNKPAEETE